MTGASKWITDPVDIQVGRPLPRQTVRATEAGYLVTCTGLHCDWQGLFPSVAKGLEAAQAHYEHERRSGTGHYGTETWTVVEFLDEATACTVDASSLGLSVTEQRYQSQSGAVREAEFPRTTGAVDAIVERGDRIQLPPGDRYGKVASVTESRALGLPTWSVTYAEPGTDLTRNDWQPKFKNELVARDGDVYCRYGPEPLAAPAFEVVGQTDHQADFSEFNGGGLA